MKRTDAPTRIRNRYGRFAQIPQALVRDPAVSDRAVRVYALLWTYSDDADREAWPSRSELAQQIGVSRDTIDRGVKELVERGALSVEYRYDGDRQASNLYTILVLPDDPEVIHRGRKSAAGVGRKSAAPGGRKSAALEQEPQEQEVKSVPEVTHDAHGEPPAAASGGDGPSIAPPTPQQLRALKNQELDTKAVFASVGHILATTTIDDAGLLVLAAEIISKAGAPVLNPTSYVVHAIRNPDTQHEWVNRAFDIAWRLAVGDLKPGVR